MTTPMTCHLDSHSNSHLLHADPRTVDRILASELNALSFDDREALNEEMHAIRSLAQSETPEMIQNAILDLEREINKCLHIDLSSFSLSSSPSTTHKKGKGKRHKENGENSVSRQEYLGDLLIVSESKVRSTSSTSDATCLTSVLPKSTTYLQKGSDNDNPISKMNRIGVTARTNYSYALSKGFLIKFLRAEFFDVKKAATRYISCIHFLVDYFGTVALERPLYLQDLDKNEQKMLKEGRLQLMPSRDRLGRRIIVFLGAVGHGYSHQNRFKLIMYMIFQAASEDETTQRNGLVAVYSRHEDNVRLFMQLAYHQAECVRLFDAVPLRYAAYHLFLPDEFHAIRGVMMNMVGKKVRLITRVHKVSSTIETSDKLRCFGIPTGDFPLTSSGSIKTKNHMKWIKFRKAQEKAQKKRDILPCYQHHQQQPPSSSSSSSSSQEMGNPNGNSSCTSSPFSGIDCPELDTVIFRNGGSAWDHPGNVKFRRILTERETDRDLHKTMAEKNAFLDGIITELFASGLKFLVYDDNKEWYVELRDYGILRKKVFQALRDQSARRKRVVTGKGQKQRRNRQTHQVNQSSTNLFLNFGKIHEQICIQKCDNDIKRRKM